MTLLLVVASWQYSYLVEVDPGVSNEQSCFESRHVRITSWGAVNVYAHVTSREHREDKRTTPPDTNIPRDVGRTSPSMWGSLRLAPITISDENKRKTTSKLKMVINAIKEVDEFIQRNQDMQERLKKNAELC